MIQYGIFDENGEIVSEFETIEEGISALKAMNDGEVLPFKGEAIGYYTEHYSLQEGAYSRVCRGKTRLEFCDGAPIRPISAEVIGRILSREPASELYELITTLDYAKARELFDGIVPRPIEWNGEERSMLVDFCFLEAEDTHGGATIITYKCQAFEGELSDGSAT